jgi:hypothetical protein
VPKSLRTISFVLVVSLFLEQLSFAADLKPAKIDLFEKQTIDFKLPESIASIEDSWRAPNASLLIYLIQDAHTNESGQLNLSKTLETILDKEDIRYIFLEAAFGDSSLSFLKKYGTSEQRKNVAKPFLKQGLMHGEEYFYLSTEKEPVLWGVESFDLYKKSIAAYKNVVKNRERLHLYLKKIQQTIETLKPKIFNPILLAFDYKISSYQHEEISLTDYFNILVEYAGYQNISLGKYPHLKELETLLNQEKAIDFEKATQQQSKAIASLAEEDRNELIDTAQNRQSVSRLPKEQHKEQKAFYALLQEKLTLRGNDSGYPDLFQYFDYLKAAKKIQTKGVLKELKSLEEETWQSLAATEDEKQLVRCVKALGYFYKLFDLTLTPEEYQEYKEMTVIARERSNDVQPFTITHLTGFLNKKIMDFNRYYERTVFLETGYDEVVKQCEEFYALTQQRDTYFIDQTLKKMQQQSQQKAILITGGYHSPNLKSILKSKGISYLCITPQVLKETNHKRYEKILLGQEFLKTATFSTQPFKTAAASANTPGILLNSSALIEYATNLAERIGIDPEKISREAQQAYADKLNAGQGGVTPSAGARLALQNPIELTSVANKDAKVWDNKETLLAEIQAKIKQSLPFSIEKALVGQQEPIKINIPTGHGTRTNRIAIYVKEDATVQHLQDAINQTFLKQSTHISPRANLSTDRRIHSSKIGLYERIIEEVFDEVFDKKIQANLGNELFSDSVSLKIGEALQFEITPLFLNIGKNSVSLGDRNRFAKRLREEIAKNLEHPFDPLKLAVRFRILDQAYGNTLFAEKDPTALKIFVDYEGSSYSVGEIIRGFLFNLFFIRMFIVSYNNYFYPSQPTQTAEKPQGSRLAGARLAEQVVFAGSKEQAFDFIDRRYSDLHAIVQSKGNNFSKAQLDEMEELYSLVKHFESLSEGTVVQIIKRNSRYYDYYELGKLPSTLISNAQIVKIFEEYSIAYNRWLEAKETGLTRFVNESATRVSDVRNGLANQIVRVIGLSELQAFLEDNGKIYKELVRPLIQAFPGGRIISDKEALRLAAAVKTEVKVGARLANKGSSKRLLKILTSAAGARLASTNGGIKYEPRITITDVWHVDNWEDLS